MSIPINSDTSKNFPPAGHYSHSYTAAGLVFISGQLPITESGIKLSNASFEEQTRQVLRNLDVCLNNAGVTREMLVQVRVYVTDINKWPIFNQIYAEWIGNHLPSRAVAGVSELHYGSAVEVEAIAISNTIHQ